MTQHLITIKTNTKLASTILDLEPAFLKDSLGAEVESVGGKEHEGEEGENGIDRAEHCLGDVGSTHAQVHDLHQEEKEVAHQEVVAHVIHVRDARQQRGGGTPEHDHAEKGEGGDDELGVERRRRDEEGAPGGAGDEEEGEDYVHDVKLWPPGNRDFKRQRRGGV